MPVDLIAFFELLATIRIIGRSRRNVFVIPGHFRSRYSRGWVGVTL